MENNQNHTNEESEPKTSGAEVVEIVSEIEVKSKTKTKAKKAKIIY